MQKRNAITSKAKFFTKTSCDGTRRMPCDGATETTCDGTTKTPSDDTTKTCDYMI